MSHASSGPIRRGFTLIELLVVMGIIGILIGITLPAVGYARTTMRTAQCKSNLHNIGLALMMYVDRQGAFGVFPDVAQMPYRDAERHKLRYATGKQSLVKILAPFIENSEAIFNCPSDTAFLKTAEGTSGVQTSYFDIHGLSYEYPNSRLANKRQVELLGDKNGVSRYSSSEVMLAYDFQNFHGQWMGGDAIIDESPGEDSPWEPKNTGIRNVLYLDGHVDSL